MPIINTSIFISNLIRLDVVEMLEYYSDSQSYGNG